MSSYTTQITTGDTEPLLVTLKAGAPGAEQVAVDVSTAVSIKARLVTADRQALTPSVVQSSGTTGAVWASGIVALLLGDTSLVEPQLALIEIQVYDGTYERTWWAAANVVKGNIN